MIYGSPRASVVIAVTGIVGAFLVPCLFSARFQFRSVHKDSPAMAPEDSSLAEAKVADSGAWLMKWGGNEVCRQTDLDSGKSVERYRYKMQKLKSLAAELREKTCGKSCPQKWLALKARMMHFQSCIELLSVADASKTPLGLQEAMASGADSLRAGLREPMSAVSKLLEKYKLFPQFDDLPQCSFDPTRLAIDSAVKSKDPEDSVRKQLFGQECSEEAAKQYTGRLKGTTQRIATDTLGQISQALASTKQNAIDVAANLTKELDEGQEEDSKVFGELVTQVTADEEADDLDMTNGTSTSGALLQVWDLNEEDFDAEDFFKDFKKLIVTIVKVVLIIYIAFFLLIAAAFSGGGAFGPRS